MLKRSINTAFVEFVICALTTFLHFAMFQPLETSKHEDDCVFWSLSEIDGCRFVGTEDGSVSEV